MCLKQLVFGLIEAAPRSRKEVYDRAQHKLNLGLSIIIFLKDCANERLY